MDVQWQALLAKVCMYKTSKICTEISYPKWKSCHTKLADFLFMLVFFFLFYCHIWSLTVNCGSNYDRVCSGFLYRNWIIFNYYLWSRLIVCLIFAYNSVGPAILEIPFSLSVVTSPLWTLLSLVQIKIALLDWWVDYLQSVSVAWIHPATFEVLY